MLNLLYNYNKKEDDMKKQTFIRVNDDSRRELKKLAVKEDITMIEMLDKLLEFYKNLKQ